MAHDLHEALVEAFFAQARLDDPERFAAVCARNPVKSRRQLRTIAELELSAGLQPQKLRRRQIPRGSHRTNSIGAPAERRYEVVQEAS